MRSFQSKSVWWILPAIVLALAIPARVGAQVSCADPDNLCTGNPCVIDTVTVVPPCEVDFGNRTLEITGIVTVPDGGTLSFTANAIRLHGRIDGRNAGTGAAVTLVATGDTLETDGKIDVTGGAGGGTVALNGLDLVVDGKIRAGSKLGPGGSVTLVGGAANVQQSIDVRGATGGSITTQTVGMEVWAIWDARGLTGSGGSITIMGVYTAFYKGVDARGHGGNGGTVTVYGESFLATPGKILASGSLNGGAINLFGPLLMWGKLLARGASGNGGTLVVSAPDPGDGLVAIPTVRGDFRGGAGGGSVQIDADEIAFGKELRAGGKTGPGAIRMHHNGTQPAELAGKLDARDSGIVEVLAPNADLTVSGTFSAGPAGCVGVSAGGTLDTTGLASDVALTASCP